jgi:hypothetical protein
MANSSLFGSVATDTMDTWSIHHKTEDSFTSDIDYNLNAPIVMYKLSALKSQMLQLDFTDSIMKRHQFTKAKLVNIMPI